MKLEPKAKPIRIRIKIGNEEYSTFDSLRENLSLPELYPLFLDGRFVKWLNQIGEKERAERSEKLKAECKKEDDRTRNYILLLSLFDKEVEQALSKYNHSPIEWPNVIRYILSRLNSKERFKEVKKLFEVDDKSLLLDAKGWGGEMAKLVKESEQGLEIKAYKDLFDYLIAYSIEHEDAKKRVHIVIKCFYNNLKDDYPLVKVLTTDDLLIENLSILYSLEILKGLDIKWDELFVCCVKQAENKQNKEVVFKIIKEIRGLIGNNNELWQSFINQCIKLEVKEAKAFNNEWGILANSVDYEIVNTAFQDFRRFGPKKFNESIVEYTSLKNDLGKQIVDLLIFLKELPHDENAKRPDLSDDYLKCLTSLMVMVRKYQYKNWSFMYSHHIPQEYKTYLKEMKAKNIKLASNILNNEDWGYIDICTDLIEEIQSKLNEKRMIQ